MRDWQKIGAVSLWATAAVGLAGAVLADNDGMDMGGPGMAAMFQTLDADKDGKVTQTELDAHHAARVAEVDANKDGLLSADELAQMQIKAFTERATRMSAKMIVRLDSDGDGLLSAAEILAGPGPVMMLDRLDTDGDGAITEAEMLAAQDRMDGRGGDMGHGMKGGHRGHHGGGFWGMFGGDDTH